MKHLLFLLATFTLLAGCSTTTLDEELVISAAKAVAAELCRVQADEWHPPAVPAQPPESPE